MSIKFICSCGKHLRARDEMAARRSRCPRCGEPVGIPSLRPMHAGTEASAPLTPQERRRRNRLAGRSDDDTVAVATALPPQPPSDAPPAEAPPPRRRRPRPPRQMETHWYQCLAYPFYCGRLLALLALTLASLGGCLTLLVPELPHQSEITTWGWLPYAAQALPPLLVLAYVCGTIECALASALAGQGPGDYWPGRQLDLVLKSVVRWLVCFLAGPIVPVVLAGCYWLYGGELAGLDWLIIGELIVLAVGYWLLAVVKTAESGRLRHANPRHVGQLLRRLGFRAVIPVLLAPALAFAHVLHGCFALGELHRHAFAGWLLLLLTCGSALFFAMFLFRLLGVWCYRKV